MHFFTNLKKNKQTYLKLICIACDFDVYYYVDNIFKHCFPRCEERGYKKNTGIASRNETHSGKDKKMNKESEALTKHEIAKRVANRTQISAQDAIEIIQATLDVMMDHLVAGGRIEIRNFGVFEPRTRGGGIGRNPRKPGEKVVILPRKTIKFRPGKNVMKRLAAEK